MILASVLSLAGITYAQYYPNDNYGNNQYETILTNITMMIIIIRMIIITNILMITTLVISIEDLIMIIEMR